MNKNIIKLFAILMMCFLLGSVLVACGSTNEGEEDIFTVEINKDGYWVINGVVTTVKAAGKDGLNGTPGTPGVNATDCEKHDYNIYDGDGKIVAANGNKWDIKSHAHDCLPSIIEGAGKKATCTEGGYDVLTCDCPRGTLWVCVDCGDAKFEWTEEKTWNGNFTEALGHSYNDVVTAPTCVADGYVTSTCATCGDVKVTAGEAATSVHTYGDWYDSDYGAGISTCDCERPVYRAHTCTVCTYTEHEKVSDAPGHVFDVWNNALPVDFQSPCTQKPREVSVCSVCKHEKCNSYRDVPGSTAPGHSAGYETVWTIVDGKTPTLTTPGMIETKCENCWNGSYTDKGYKTKEIPALNTTDYTVKTTDANCTAAGQSVYTLIADTHIQVTVVIPAKGHNFVDSTELDDLVAPSYAAAGSVTVGCKDCDHTEKVEIAQLSDATKSFITEKGDCYGKKDKYTMTLKTTDGDEFKVSFEAKGDYTHDAEPAELTLINPSVEGEKAYWGYWCTKCQHWIFVKEA